MRYDIQFTTRFKKDLKLVIYEIKDDVLVLLLYRLGTHSDLF